MKFIARVKTNSRATSVEKLEDDSYKVCVTAAPEKGKANTAVIAALADFFKVSKSKIDIVAGHTAHTKIIEVYQAK